MTHRVSIVVFTLLMLLTTFATPAARAENAAVARLALSGEPTVLMGEMVKLYVEVVAPQPFSDAPVFPELELPGAIALQPEQMGNSFSERHGADTWFGVRKAYVVFAQRPGDLAIPPVVVRLGTAVDAQRLITNGLTLDVSAPSVDVPLDRLVVTSRLAVRERVDADLEALVVGDALKRRVRVDADNSLGLLIPPLQFEVPDGLVAYPAKPDISDKANRGQYSGSRTEQVTFMLTRPGSFVLPAIDIYWFNTRTQSLETETLAAVEFTVAASARDANSSGEGNDAAALMIAVLDWLRDYLAAVTLFAISLYLLWRLGRRVIPRMLARLAAAQNRRRTSESRYFRDLERAIEADDDWVASFWRWVDRVNPGGSWSALLPDSERPGDFVRLCRDEEARRYAEGGGAKPDKSELVGAVRTYRKGLKNRRGAQHATTGRSLNPRTSERRYPEYGRVGKR